MAWLKWDKIKTPNDFLSLSVTLQKIWNFETIEQFQEAH